ncbi:MAG: hypothetical protein GY822_08395 [Deltaproteobacteria bacterium]|nr:hypothetical protein [Deltaproteobacteria bacterium]
MSLVADQRPALCPSEIISRSLHFSALSAVVLGPGWGKSTDTLRRGVLKVLGKPAAIPEQKDLSLVVDADALLDWSIITSGVAANFPCVFTP